MKSVYLNHAGTSWPKPDCVKQAAAEAADRSLLELDQDFDDHHQRVADWFGVANKDRLLLTPGCTSSLGLAISDVDLPAESKIVASSFEHHAMHRNLIHKVRQGYQLEIIPPAVDGPFDLQRLASVLAEGDVSLVAVCSASNVTGQHMPVQEIAKLTKQHNALMLVDAAQTVGWLDYDLESTLIDLFAFGGHKGLLAPWGIGGLWVREGVNMATPQAVCEIPAEPIPGSQLKPTSCSVMPGYCDGGSVDRIALAGLQASLRWLTGNRERVEVLRKETRKLADAVADLPGVQVYGWDADTPQLPTIAFNVGGMETKELSQRLKQRGILAASGLQCAPLAHQILGTEPDGVVRLSLGAMTKLDEVEYSLGAIRDLRDELVKQKPH